ncbi:hypothetical protein FACS1894193_13390 [Bacilli bacterium]|nr:hypothetical protein FACS1894193_13390 [Bacilli bacterium]
MNNKEIKSIKQEISEHSALSIGFQEDIFAKMTNPLTWQEAIKNEGDDLAFMAKGIHHSDLDIGLKSALVTAYVKAATFEEFKEMAPYFFSYKKTDEEILAEPISISRAMFLEFQHRSDKLFDYENDAMRADQASSSQKLSQLIDHVTTSLVSNNNQPLAYNPLTQTLAVLDGWDYMVEPGFEDGLISDYRRSENEAKLIVERLLDLDYQPLNEKVAVDIAVDDWQKDSDYLLDKLETYYDEAELPLPKAVRTAESFEAAYRIVSQPGDGCFGGDNIQEVAWKLVEDEFYNHDFLADKLNDAPGNAFLNTAYISELNDILKENNQEVVTRVVRGYSQGDVWSLSYLLDNNLDPDVTPEMVNAYLEHEIGAYYRGSLTSLSIYNQKNELVDQYTVDSEEFWPNESEKVQELTGERGFLAIETALALEELADPLDREGLKEFISKSPEEQAVDLQILQNDEKLSQRSTHTKGPRR